MIQSENSRKPPKKYNFSKTAIEISVFKTFYGPPQTRIDYQSRFVYFKKEVILFGIPLSAWLRFNARVYARLTGSLLQCYTRLITKQLLGGKRLPKQ
jgi:hypothetical protein